MHLLKDEKFRKLFSFMFASLNWFYNNFSIQANILQPYTCKIANMLGWRNAWQTNFSYMPTNHKWYRYTPGNKVLPFCRPTHKPSYSRSILHMTQAHLFSESLKSLLNANYAFCTPWYKRFHVCLFLMRSIDCTVRMHDHTIEYSYNTSWSKWQVYLVDLISPTKVFNV